MMKRVIKKALLLFVIMLLIAVAFHLGERAKKQNENEVMMSPVSNADSVAPVSDEKVTNEPAISSSVQEEKKGESASRVEEKAIVSEKTNSVLPEKDKAEEEIVEEKLVCNFSVSCNTIIPNIERLDAEKHSLVPSDGFIYKKSELAFNDGDTVFDVLLREMTSAGIHLEFDKTPLYGNVYIEGIGNLYEFDCGELSGWMYRVNGAFPNFGCDGYTLKAGDKVEWVYTCNLGRDVGGDYFAQNGK